MKRYTVTVHPGNRLTIPSQLRHELDLHPGDSLVWFEQDGEILFRKAKPDEVADIANDADRQTPSGNDTDMEED